MTDERYASQIAIVMQECPEADEDGIGKEFARYEEEFLIPPEDALRSVIRKFQVATGKEVTSGISAPVRAEKKVNRFSELGADDKNVSIEVAVVTYTPRIQTVKGEERQVAFGWIEDNPWESSSKRERWDFKDWGEKSESLAPGSIVRLEGASVNEWNDKRSLNINRTTRVTILREGGAAAPRINDEPLSISKASEVEGYVNVVARILTSKPGVIVKRDGSGQIDVVRGSLADPSGSIGFLSWVPFEHQEGSLVKIVGASVRKFRDTPEINISDGTVIEPYHDTAFPDMSELAASSKSTIADLRNGMRDVEVTLQVESWNQRTFDGEDGSQRVVRSGDVIDPSGRCRLTAWCEFDPKPGDFIHIEGGRVQFWQGSPDLVIDQIEQVIDLSDPPWKKIDPEGHWIDLDLTDIVNGGSRRGIKTLGTVVAVRPDSGIVERCPECRRVLRDSACMEHGPQRGNEDLRLRFVIDNGVSNASLLMSREPAEAFLGIGMDEVRDQIASEGRDGFVASLRTRALSGAMVVHGRTIVDDYGAMVLADTAEFEESSPSEAAQEVMQRWGVVL